jgi:hypothetical protein
VFLLWARLIVLTLKLWTVTRAAARLQASEARKKLGQYPDALEAGLDPALIAEGTRVAQGELASATAVMDAFSPSG